MNGKILIIGGYGNVGRIIATLLSKQFPRKIIVAGRNYPKAKEFSLELRERVIPMALDISLVSANDGLLDDVGIVIMCLDQENIEFVRQCIQRGIHYIDISASYHILSRIETLNEEAEKAGATAVLSVGLAPGLTNLLTRHCQSKLPDMTYADIYLLFGLGEVHGDAAYQWISENLNTEFTVSDNGETKRVKSFEVGKQTILPGKIGKRTAYQYNFPEQHVLLQTLGLGRVSTWLCFDSAWATSSFALIKRTGLSRVITIKSVEKSMISILKRLHLILKRLHLGSEEFVIKVEGGNSPEKGVLYECSLRGESEARVTGLVTAKVAEKLVLSSFPSGVFHIEQLITPIEFLASLGNHGLKFEEKEYVTVRAPLVRSLV